MTIETNISRTVYNGAADYPIIGWCDPRFSAVADAFCANFEAGEEVGAHVALTVDGAPVVDLWGGWQDRDHARAWDDETIVLTMSTTKGVAAICFNILVDRGLVDLDAPVSRYWPEFAAAGKETVPVRYLLDHRAGIPLLDANLPAGSIFDFDRIVEALAAQTPMWEPGSEAAYHVHFQGFLLGEVMRRVTGMNIGQFLKQELAGPLGLDFHIGLGAADQARCARFLVEPKLFAVRFAEDRNILSRSWDEFPAERDMETILNSPEFRAADISSASGHGRASALARLYGALARGGEIDGMRIMSPEAVARMTTVQHALWERRANRQYQQALGLLRNSPPAMDMGPNPNSFGHAGIGGSIGFADPDRRFGFGYVMNQMHAMPGTGTRFERLIHGVYQSLGA